MFCADWALMFGFCGCTLRQLREAGFSDAALLAAPAPAVLGAVSALIYNLSVKLTGGLLVGFTNN